MVRHSLGAAEIIRRTDVLHPGDHGFLAAVLDPGMRAVTVGVDAVTGSAGLIWPGDRVDLILTQTIGDTAVPMGRRVAAESVLSDARVIAIDQRLVQDADSNTSADHARTVTLEVTPEQAARISVAMRLGKLSLAVRSVEPAVTASPNTIWAADVSAALSGGAAPSPAPPAKVRVFEGAGTIKEYTF
jgi:pilus assembly protein CpaB